MDGGDVSRTAVERLRSLVGGNGWGSWDYCIIWKISEDQRSMQFLGCCCGGVENYDDVGGGGGGEQLFPVLLPSNIPTCRDSKFGHARTVACDSLAQLPNSINLELNSGIYAQVLMSNQSRWIFLSNTVDSPNILGETVSATQVLIPVTGGLVELFAAKHIPEDHRVIDFITSMQYSNLNIDNPHEETTSVSYWDQTVDQLRVSVDPPLNLFGQPRYNKEGGLIFEAESMDVNDKGSGEMARRAESVASDGSNPGDDEDDNKMRGGGKKHQSCKNLMAERRRRKKLNDRLYVLRSLVPNISKMDRASILGDAIEFVNKLQHQVKELQEELEKTTSSEDEEGGKQTNGNVEDDEIQNHTNSNSNSNILNHQAVLAVLKEQSVINKHTKGVVEQDQDHDGDPNSKKTRTELDGSGGAKQGHRAHSSDENGEPPMEVQVEVFQVSRNGFFLKVFCQYKAGGFVKLMEDLNSLGFEVTNANVTTFTKLVLNVLKIEKRDSEAVEASQLRESLLDRMRPENSEWRDSEYYNTVMDSHPLHYLHHR